MTTCEKLGTKRKKKKENTKKTAKFFLEVSIQSALQCMTYLLNTIGIRILKYIDILMSWCSAIPKADADMDIYIATSIATCLTSISDQNKQHAYLSTESSRAQFPAYILSKKYVTLHMGAFFINIIPGSSSAAFYT